MQAAGGTAGREAAKGLDRQGGRVGCESFCLYEMRDADDYLKDYVLKVFGGKAGLPCRDRLCVLLKYALMEPPRYTAPGYVQRTRLLI